VVASIRTPQYELKLYKAIAFVPKQENAEGSRLKPDHRYLVLDISVQNTAKTKEVDMGQVLLSAKLQDKKGRTYPLNAMAVASFTLENPDPEHQAQYNALWGKLKPGETYRTKAVGFDVPTTAKEFSLSMNADDNSQPDSKRQQLKFTLE
ncbi:MAG TPA: DUF4352 domain-containing protein, partial [Flavisolibacter sp.]|nr:DUF4352 domain-containing protein [Flavisolibacter sp.]